MLKINQIIRLLSILTLLYGCNHKSNKIDELNSNGVKELEYLTDFIYKYKQQGKVSIDSFNTLYNSLIVFNINDSNIIFTSFYRNWFLLYVSKDSIAIYKTSCCSKLNYIVPQVMSILEKNNLDSAINTINRESFIVYKYKFGKFYAKIFSVDVHSKDCYLLDYHQKQSLSWSFSFVKRIKNNYIELGKTHFVNTWPYNVDSLSFFRPFNKM